MLLIEARGAALEPVTAWLSREGCGHEVIRHPAERLQIVATPAADAEPRIARGVQALAGVERVAALRTPYVLSAREAAGPRTRVRFGGVEVGGEEFVVMAGPCSVESREQTALVARAVEAAGSRVLRGGAFKPRTSPFGFQGLGRDGLAILREVGDEVGLPVVSELMDQRELEAVDEAVDVIQIGMRNALNYALLRDVGRLRSRRPVLLKCGIGTKLEEFLCAADYVLAGGNPNVILCLRGTIGISKESRSALNVADIPALRQRTHLPILVDPSHVAGAWELVPAIAASAVVAGADGLIVEVHHRPEEARSDGRQSLHPDRFRAMMRRLRLLAGVMGRSIAAGSGHLASAGAHPFDDLCLEAPPPPAPRAPALRAISGAAEPARSAP